MIQPYGVFPALSRSFFWAAICLVPVDLACASESLLSRTESESLIRRTPAFLGTINAKGCPSIEVLWIEATAIFFQVRNMCPRSGSGLIGNYLVDRTTAEVWEGIDRDVLINSDALTKYQAILRRRMIRARKH